MGKQQVDLLARFLKSGEADHKSYLLHDPSNSKGFGLTHLYSSLMWRALETASSVAERLDLPIYGLEDIYEGGGIYLKDAESGERVGQPGKTPQELQAAFPRLVLPEGLNPKGWWNRPFETREARKQRGHQVLNWLLQRHANKDDRVALFSHGGFYNDFVRAIMKIEESTAMWLEMNNCGISRFDFYEDGVSLVYHNRVSFLPDELIT